MTIQELIDSIPAEEFTPMERADLDLSKCLRTFK